MMLCTKNNDMQRGLGGYAFSDCRLARSFVPCWWTRSMSTKMICHNHQLQLCTVRPGRTASTRPEAKMSHLLMACSATEPEVAPTPDGLIRSEMARPSATENKQTYCQKCQHFAWAAQRDSQPPDTTA
jgi:hypothetical protein